MLVDSMLPRVSAGSAEEVRLFPLKEYGPGFFAVEVGDLPLEDLIVQWRGPILRIEDFSIKSSQQNRGCGAAVLRALEAWAGANGVRRIELESVASARPFWARMGFEETGGEASEPDWVLMAKRVIPAGPSLAPAA